MDACDDGLKPGHPRVRNGPKESGSSGWTRAETDERSELVEA